MLVSRAFATRQLSHVGDFIVFVHNVFPEESFEDVLQGDDTLEPTVLVQDGATM